MSEQSSLTVEGYFETVLTADKAVLSITLEREGASGADARAALFEAYQKVSSVLDEYEVPLVARSSTFSYEDVDSQYAKTRWAKKGSCAMQHVSVKVPCEPEILQELALKVKEIEHVVRVSVLVTPGEQDVLLEDLYNSLSETTEKKALALVNSIGSVLVGLQSVELIEDGASNIAERYVDPSLSDFAEELMFACKFNVSVSAYYTWAIS